MLWQSMFRVQSAISFGTPVLTQARLHSETLAGFSPIETIEQWHGSFFGGTEFTQLLGGDYV